MIKVIQTCNKEKVHVVLKKVGACTEGGDRKKELKEPVRINENQ